MQKTITFRDAVTVVANAFAHDGGFNQRAEFFAGEFGDKPIHTITAEDVENALDAAMARGRVQTINMRGRIMHRASDKPLSGATRNRFLSGLGSIFKELNRRRLLPRGHLSPTRGVLRAQGDNARTLTVTVDDVRRLVAACRLSRNRKLAAITAMACTTGWRLGSLQNLQWRDIDLNQGHADVLKTKNGTPHRAVLLPWVVAEVKRMRELEERRNKQRGLPPLTASDYVFGKKAFRRTWQTALKLAELPPTWTFHHTRHIAASILAQSGASVPTIMAALNQKSPSMALRYSHLNTDALRDSLSRAWG